MRLLPWMALALVPAIPALAQSAQTRVNAKDVIRIEIGAPDAWPTPRPRAKRSQCDCAVSAQEAADMQARIRRLELAVRQLQDEVFELSGAQRPAPTPTPEPKPWVCTLTDSFNTTHLAKAGSEIEARGLVMQRCQAAGHGGLHCNEEKVKCGR